MGDRQSTEVTNNPANRSATLEGVLERIVFFNEENSFTVARLQVQGKQDLVIIVGALSLPTPGETLITRSSVPRAVHVGECKRRNYLIHVNVTPHKALGQAKPEY